MPVVSTAKKNSPSNRPSRLRTASYLVSSSITPSSVGQDEDPGWRKSDAELPPGAPTAETVYAQRPRFASIAALPCAPFRFQSRLISALSRASVLATIRWFSRMSLR